MDTAILVAIIGGLLGGSAVAALITQIGESARQKRKRNYEEDDEENKDITALKVGLKWVIYDRIRFLGQSYIAQGEIDFDDRRILNEMHSCYHNGLNGNGDLDSLMNQVNILPLKSKDI